MARQDSHPGQLDLFLHSRAVMLANEAIDALLRRETARAAACLDRLYTEEPAYPACAALQTLSAALGEWPMPSANPAEILDAVRWLEADVHPAALAALGRKAPDFMRPFWRDLANAAVGHPYEPNVPQAFCAGLYLRCQDHLAAAKAAESIPNHENNTDALHWLAVARYRKEGLETCRPPLVRLALLAPQRLPSLLAELGDPLLQQDWHAFRVACHWLDPKDPRGYAWFPAWYLLEHPGMRVAPEDGAPPLPTTLPAQAFVAMARLIDLEKRGYSEALISARSRLRDLAPELFALHMARREAGHH